MEIRTINFIIYQMKSLFLILLTLYSIQLLAQNYGEIQGDIYSEDSTEIIPFARVILYSTTDTVVVISDINGTYKFTQLSSDLYNIEVQSSLFGMRKILNIQLIDSGIIKLNIYLRQLITYGFGCDFGSCWPPQHGYFRGEEHIVKLPFSDLGLIKSKQILEKITSPISNHHNQFNEVSIRGSRSGDIIFYVDGFKFNKAPKQVSYLNFIEYYSNGIPAKYGDTMGGVIILHTKGYFDLYYEWKSKQ